MTAVERIVSFALTAVYTSLDCSEVWTAVRVNCGLQSEQN